MVYDRIHTLVANKPAGKLDTSLVRMNVLTLSELPVSQALCVGYERTMTRVVVFVLLPGEEEPSRRSSLYEPEWPTNMDLSDYRQKVMTMSKLVGATVGGLPLLWEVDGYAPVKRVHLPIRLSHTPCSMPPQTRRALNDKTVAIVFNFPQSGIPQSVPAPPLSRRLYQNALTPAMRGNVRSVVRRRGFTDNKYNPCSTPQGAAWHARVLQGDVGTLPDRLQEILRQSPVLDSFSEYRNLSPDLDTVHNCSGPMCVDMNTVTLRENLQLLPHMRIRWEPDKPDSCQSGGSTTVQPSSLQPETSDIWAMIGTKPLQSMLLTLEQSETKLKRGGEGALRSLRTFLDRPLGRAILAAVGVCCLENVWMGSDGRSYLAACMLEGGVVCHKQQGLFVEGLLDAVSPHIGDVHTLPLLSSVSLGITFGDKVSTPQAVTKQGCTQVSSLCPLVCAPSLFSMDGLVDPYQMLGRDELDEKDLGLRVHHSQGICNTPAEFIGHCLPLVTPTLTHLFDVIKSWVVENPIRSLHLDLAQIMPVTGHSHLTREERQLCPLGGRVPKTLAKKNAKPTNVVVLASLLDGSLWVCKTHGSRGRKTNQAILQLLRPEHVPGTQRPDESVGEREREREMERVVDVAPIPLWQYICESNVILSRYRQTVPPSNHHAVPLLQAVAAINLKGIIHGDVHLGNLLVCEGGVVEVVDFELARLSEDIVSPHSQRFRLNPCYPRDRLFENPEKEGHSHQVLLGHYGMSLDAAAALYMALDCRPDLIGHVRRAFCSVVAEQTTAGAIDDRAMFDRILQFDDCTVKEYWTQLLPKLRSAKLPVPVVTPTLPPHAYPYHPPSVIEVEGVPMRLVHGHTLMAKSDWFNVTETEGNSNNDTAKDGGKTRTAITVQTEKGAESPTMQPKTVRKRGKKSKRSKGNKTREEKRKCQKRPREVETGREREREMEREAKRVKKKRTKKKTKKSD
ncbi:hypothetical protein KIPB_002891 [Kipferlia bialata]|uniref:Protein kinase domain-containing protein n=1 Tax=Kipferlia bialata TaxID=797122 RepID=A0A9K3CRD5_9EUKA|nr:hypothetical protein KIPB_002891 [Kipferlia bialata]|eukprot:g2891.t1